MENDKLVGVAGDRPPVSMFGDADRQFRTMDEELLPVFWATWLLFSCCRIVVVLECIASLVSGVCGAECCKYEALRISPLLLLIERALAVSTVN